MNLLKPRSGERNPKLHELVLDLADRMFVGPVWPASILAILLVVYSILGMVGLFDLGLDAPDLPEAPPLGTDLTEIIPLNWDFVHGIGGTTIRWTNFGRLPIILWGGIFAVAFWGISYGFWHQFDSEKYASDWITSGILSVRNSVIAVGITKGCTQPLLKYFTPPPNYDHANLLGEICVVSTSRADSKFGQAKFQTNAAPLLLNIRTDGSVISKGSKAMIIEFEPKKRIFTVTPIPTEQVS